MDGPIAAGCGSSHGALLAAVGGLVSRLLPNVCGHRRRVIAVGDLLPMVLLLVLAGAVIADGSVLPA